MFICLQIDENNAEHFGSIKDLFRSPKVTAEKIDIPNALPFFIITSKKYRGKIPFNAIVNLSGHFKNRILFPESIALPDDFQKFEPEKLKSFLLFNSALGWIKANLNPIFTTITLIDYDGILLNNLCSLIPLSSEINIVTDKVSKYEDIADSIMESYGLSVYISEKIDSYILGSDVIIADKEEMIPYNFSGILFTNSLAKKVKGKTLIGSGITGCDELINLCPSGINKLSFLSALYEYCNIKRLENMEYAKLSRLTKGENETIIELQN